MLRLCTFVAILIAILAPALSFGAEDAPLTNDDVIKLVELGLGDAVVLAKIRQAAAVDFRLDLDDLERLKAAGVSPKPIETMIHRSTPPKLQEPLKSRYTGKWFAHVDAKPFSLELFSDDTCTAAKRREAMPCKWTALHDGRLKLEVRGETAMGELISGKLVLTAQDGDKIELLKSARELTHEQAASALNHAVRTVSLGSVIRNAPFTVDNGGEILHTTQYPAPCEVIGVQSLTVTGITGDEAQTTVFFLYAFAKEGAVSKALVRCVEASDEEFTRVKVGRDAEGMQKYLRKPRKGRAYFALHDDDWQLTNIDW